MKFAEKDFLETANPANLELSTRCRELTREYYLRDYRDPEKKQALLRELLGSVGKNASINIPFHCDHGKGIFLGDDVVIGMNCTFVDNQQIHIGSRVMIAPNVQIYTASHPVLPQERLIPERDRTGTCFFRTYAQSVTIGDNVWIGGGTIILPGVTIGKNAVIGAGSVVTRSIPANCVAMGNPCKVVRNFTGEVPEEWL